MAISTNETERVLEVGAHLETSLPSNFRGDTVLPGQYYDSVGRWQWHDGEYRLAFAVLADAVATYYRYKGARSRKGRRLFEEVRLWMHSCSRTGVFAYRNLCELLEIDPDALSAALERGRELGEPALREIRVWRGKPRRGMTVPNGASHRSSTGSLARAEAAS